MSWLTRTEPATELPVLREQTCVACHRNDGIAMGQIPLGEFGRQWVCVDASSCRQRAQLAGIYGMTGVAR